MNYGRDAGPQLGLKAIDHRVSSSPLGYPAGLVTTPPDPPIHQALIDAARPRPGTVLVDLGCGDGTTLAAAGRRDSDMVLFGVDSNQQQLVGATRRLSAEAPEVRLVMADLDRPLPLSAASVDATVCHNVLEYLAHPGDLVSEAARVLVVGGRAIWSHVEWASIIFNVADADLNRRVIETHATYNPRWMRHANGYIGRMLPGLVRGSPLEVVDVNVLLATETRFVGDARWRVNQILDTLRPPARRQEIDLTPADLDRWVADLNTTEAAGGFFFAEATVLVTSQRPVS